MQPSAPPGQTRETSNSSTGCAALHPWLQAAAPAGAGTDGEVREGDIEVEKTREPSREPSLAKTSGPLPSTGMGAPSTGDPSRPSAGGNGREAQGRGD